MLQRIQSVYIALSVILLVLCCCLPLATFVPLRMDNTMTMYSLIVIEDWGQVVSYSPIVLFSLAILAEIALLFAFLGYKNRQRQMMFCSIAIILILLWLLAYIVLCICYNKEDTTLHIQGAAFLPLAAIVLILLARHAIKKDERLVRSADRLR